MSSFLGVFKLIGCPLALFASCTIYYVLHKVVCKYQRSIAEAEGRRCYAIEMMGIQKLSIKMRLR